MKKGFTTEQHKQAGAELKQVIDKLMALYCDLRKGYTCRSRTIRLVKRAMKAARSTQCELDDRLYAEHPQVDDIEKEKIYYGREQNKGKDS